MIIRPATPDDAAAVVHVRTRGWQTGYAELMPAGYLAGMDAEREELTERLRARFADLGTDQQVWVAERDREVIGFANAGTLREDQDFDHLVPDQGEIRAIYVLPTHWRTGAGRALLDAAVGWLRETGRSPVRLWVLEGNARARTFYERYGFTLDGARSHFVIEQAGQLPVQLAEVRYALD